MRERVCACACAYVLCFGFNCSPQPHVLCATLQQVPTEEELARQEQLREERVARMKQMQQQLDVKRVRRQQPSRQQCSTGRQRESVCV